MAKRTAKKPRATQKPQKETSTNRSRYAWGIALLVIVLFGWYVVHVWRQQKAEVKAEEAIYDAFGIEMPTQFPIHGIDVSSYQNTVSWRKVSTMNINDIRMGFVFIKATEGLGNVDENYHKNYLNAKKAGLVCGAYHFFLATKSGIIQANNYLKNVRLSTGDLPPVVDIEQLYGVPAATMRKRLMEWLTTVEATYKTKPIIYSNVDFYERNLGSDFDGYPLWVAHYNVPDKPRIGRDWTFWQHSEAGHINGITSLVDCDVFNGDSANFKKLLLP
jgi:lysozyme